ncbi:hypothetical protein IW262DRAFT_226164 [Armillaria fumosa]|nr:hypothetical protein IW262DRAFT_226164 [Armillaria fumosa]
MAKACSFKTWDEANGAGKGEFSIFILRRRDSGRLLPRCHVPLSSPAPTSVENLLSSSPRRFILVNRNTLPNIYGGTRVSLHSLTKSTPALISLGTLKDMILGNAMVGRVHCTGICLQHYCTRLRKQYYTVLQEFILLITVPLASVAVITFLCPKPYRLSYIPSRLASCQHTKDPRPRRNL